MSEVVPRTVTGSEAAGVLPHEMVFLLSGLNEGRAKKREAAVAYGEAVANSGGDWALDDGASMAAAADAHIVDVSVGRRERLSRLGLREISYPDPASPHIAIGSRIGLETSEWGDNYDLASRIIPGIPVEDDILVIDAQTPLGNILIGKQVGDQLSWKTPRGEISGVITSVDQTAQRQFYANLLGIEFS